MRTWPPTLKVFLCSDATDTRKGFDSLAHLIESYLTLDSISGHLFVLRTRRGFGSRSSPGTGMSTRCGTIGWRGSFRFPAAARATENVEIKTADLLRILDGVDLGRVRRPRRYSRESVEIPGESFFRSLARPYNHGVSDSDVLLPDDVALCHEIIHQQAETIRES